MGYSSVLRADIFSDNTMLVTGGGSGIGRCVAHELAALGAHVVIIGRKLEKLENVATEIIEDGGSVSYYTCDIRDEDKVKDVISTVIKEHGEIHGLVNNAGGQFPSPLAAINKKGWDAVISTNLTGGFLVAREVFTQCMNTRGGSIVNIVADMWGGMPGMGHSGAARAGMVNFTQTAAVEWGPCGVRVNAVAPGWIMSSGLDTYDDFTKQTIKKLKHHVPLQRLATEAEVSSVISFLLCDGSAFINGDTIKIDGGAPLGGAMFPLPQTKPSKMYNGFHRYEIPDVLKDDFE
ncbi:2,4-dienoyl-CoA reductase [Gammaproteobacteria bacterium 45_16_T64]|nr:2,4-dienoyl-CoA reductase [Gammaproteobacteria bacterium 45_16_T64]